MTTHFAIGPWTPEQMIAAVKAEQQSREFTSRWDKHAQRGGGQGKRNHPKTAALEASILAAMAGEMPASQIAKAIGQHTSTVATALGRMVQDGRVIRQYVINRIGNRQMGVYRRAEAQ